ncbi:30S ribosomal protein S5 [Candidatus Uhrbacteria bacterium]|nr:30S ribosomal protein S5 [Candidatus Uhrbacteria bacterium]
MQSRGPERAQRTGGPRGGDRRGGQGGRPGGRGGDRRGGRPEREPREFEQKILELARVTRVTKGGKRMRFRACLIIGDRRGRVGMGVAKGADVAMAVEKAFRKAKKDMVTIPLTNETIPHVIDRKFAAARVLLKPAPQGTGLKCGGPVRVILELGGVPNAVSKVMGSKNKINNAKAVMTALKSLKARPAKETAEATA